MLPLNSELTGAVPEGDGRVRSLPVLGLSLCSTLHVVSSAILRVCDAPNLSYYTTRHSSAPGRTLSRRKSHSVGSIFSAAAVKPQHTAHCSVKAANRAAAVPSVCPVLRLPPDPVQLQADPERWTCLPPAPRNSWANEPSAGNGQEWV